METMYNDDIDRLSSMVHKVGMVRAALDMLCESFLVRCGDPDEDPLWKAFFRIQMSAYMRAKRSFDMERTECDMIHDLIRDTWTEVKLYMDSSSFGPIENPEQWFRTIEITFPVDDLEMEKHKMCQNDAKTRQFLRIV